MASESSPSRPSSSKGVFWLLSLMMFLEIYIWGSWFVQNFSYLGKIGFDEDQQFIINSGFPFAALAALFGLTALVDRKFSAEKYLAFAHFIGGLAMIGLGFAREFVPANLLFPVFAALMYLHCLAYVPTISVANSIAFTHMTDGAQFGRVRLWGTIGWIAAGLPFIYLLTDWTKVNALGDLGLGAKLNAIFDANNGKSGDAWLGSVVYVYVAAGIASLLLSAISLMLPHTPPKPARPGNSSNATIQAISLLKNPFILVLFIVTFIDAMIHQGYFLVIGSFLGSPKEANGVGLPAGLIQAVTSIGQVAEIVTMACLGWVLKKLGWRTTMIIGILGHAARFAVFAYFPEPAPAILVNTLHGICYAFFFATVYIFIDAYFPKEISASAQGLFNFLILGFGVVVANYVWPKLLATFTTKMADGSTIVDWNGYFKYPSLVALGGAMLLLLFFHPPKHGAGETSTAALPH
ncbi:MFS transporter [Zavarzinella formosa]|uniref:MFS transporter n=1 Tax=Zavarzinella formosa TaxID=360055 RepID=UPI0003116BC7|nr:MFS transporter [Zavarzinella formosa]